MNRRNLMQPFRTSALILQKAERIPALNNPLMQFCLYVNMTFVLSFGSYTIITSRGMDLDVGQFSALLTYGFMMLASLMMLSMIFVMITMAAESGKELQKSLRKRVFLPIRKIRFMRLRTVWFHLKT